MGTSLSLGLASLTQIKAKSHSALEQTYIYIQRLRMLDTLPLKHSHWCIRISECKMNETHNFVLVSEVRATHHMTLLQRKREESYAQPIASIHPYWEERRKLWWISCRYTVYFYIQYYYFFFFLLHFSCFNLDKSYLNVSFSSCLSNIFFSVWGGRFSL